jgi:hypothetical protein
VARRARSRSVTTAGRDNGCSSSWLSRIRKTLTRSAWWCSRLLSADPPTSRRCSLSERDEVQRRARADRRICSSGVKKGIGEMVRDDAGIERSVSPAARLHRFRRCPVHVPVRPPAWDQEPSAHRTTVPPSAMSRFHSSTQGGPSHSRFQRTQSARVPRAVQAPASRLSLPPRVDGKRENAHGVAGNRITGLGLRAPAMMRLASPGDGLGLTRGRGAAPQATDCRVGCVARGRAGTATSSASARHRSCRCAVIQ